MIDLPGVSEIYKSHFTQKYALACFYFSIFKVGNLCIIENLPVYLRGDDWIIYPHEYTWYGVTCIDGEVVLLGLPTNNIARTVQVELSLHGTILCHLDLAGNNVFNVNEDMSWIKEMVELSR